MAVFSFLRNTALAVVLTAAGAMSANAAIVSNSDTQSFEPFGFMGSSQDLGIPPFQFGHLSNHNGSYTFKQSQRQLYV
jgi:hypothetical protein